MQNTVTMIKNAVKESQKIDEYFENTEKRIQNSAKSFEKGKLYADDLQPDPNENTLINYLNKKTKTFNLG